MSEGTVLHSTAMRAVEFREHFHIMQPERMHEWGENSQQEVDEVHYHQDHDAYDNGRNRELSAVGRSAAQHGHYDVEGQLVRSIRQTHRSKADG